MFANAISGNTVKLAGDNVLDFISERLKYAGRIEVINNGNYQNAKYSNVLWLNNEKKLSYKTSSDTKDNIFGDDFYDKNKLEIVVQPIDTRNNFV